MKCNRRASQIIFHHSPIRNSKCVRDFNVMFKCFRECSERIIGSFRKAYNYALSEESTFFHFYVEIIILLMAQPFQWKLLFDELRGRELASELHLAAKLHKQLSAAIHLHRAERIHEEVFHLTNNSHKNSVCWNIMKFFDAKWAVKNWTTTHTWHKHNNYLIFFCIYFVRSSFLYCNLYAVVVVALSDFWLALFHFSYKTLKSEWINDFAVE